MGLVRGLAAPPEISKQVIPKRKERCRQQREGRREERGRERGGEHACVRESERLCGSE
jgi:hypothetical protein